MSGTNQDSTYENVRALTEGYCNGTLSVDESSRLESLLLIDVEARSYFRRYLALDAALRDYGESAATSWAPSLHDVHRVSERPNQPAGLGGPFADPSDRVANGNANRRFSMLHSRSTRWPLRTIGIVVGGIIGLAAIVATVFNQARPQFGVVGILEQVTGDVHVLFADGRVLAATSDTPLHQGDTVQTSGNESLTVMAYPDGTRLTLAGDTSVTWGDSRYNSVVVHQGTLAATVESQAAENPLRLATPSAQVEVIGTRFQLEALANRTDLSVTQGRVRLVRNRDGKSVEVPNGKYASVTDQNPLVIENIPSLRSTWDVDFERRVSDGWDRGEWVTQGLPHGSHGAMRAVPDTSADGSGEFLIRSNDGWLIGLFAIQPNSHLHFTFKVDRPTWVNVFLVTRTSDSHDPRFSGNYLFNEFPKIVVGRWQTVSVPLAAFKRQHRGTVAIQRLVPFRVVFTTPGSDRGLVIDRVWVTPDGPGDIHWQASQ